MIKSRNIFHMKKIVLTAICYCFSYASIVAQNTILFPSLDSVQIAADLYIAHDSEAPFIILFHQATYSRGEYLEIAPKLNMEGFNCMAVDLRSGYGVNNIANITAQNAKKAKMPYRFIDTYQDIKSAVDYARKNLAKGTLIIWGSSYSSSLVIKYAGEYKNVDGVLSFSPGEYFKNEGKPADFITKTANGVTAPVFITSKQTERANWIDIYSAIPSKKKVYFLPEFEGKHGSAALWEKTEGNDKYWEAVLSFLIDLK